jgi:non-ribosomal peptide synthetase component E (peptide arylation enzyme)
MRGLPHARKFSPASKAVLADYKVPEWLEIVSEIPRNGLGKIDRKLLRATMAFRGEAIWTHNPRLRPRTA